MWYLFITLFTFQPSNIFISEDLCQVQVGDFGLACCLVTHNTVPLVQQPLAQHKGRIGTKLYAAPEQIRGVCSAKVNIFTKLLFYTKIK